MELNLTLRKSGSSEIEEVNLFDIEIKGLYSSNNYVDIINPCNDGSYHTILKAESIIYAFAVYGELLISFELVSFINGCSLDYRVINNPVIFRISNGKRIKESYELIESDSYAFLVNPIKESELLSEHTLGEKFREEDGYMAKYYSTYKF